MYVQLEIISVRHQNAFFNGDLSEEVYMDIPQGYIILPVRKLNKLFKALRYTNFSSTLLNHGFHQSLHDYSLFTKGTGNSFVALVVYFDDIIIDGENLLIL